MTNNYHYLTIDPGLHSTGVALWSVTRWRSGDAPVRAECVRGPTDSSLNFLTRAKMIASYLQALEKRYRVDKAWVEFPIFFQSAGGHMAAAAGDLQKIAATAGVFAGALSCLVEPVLVNQWKGQLPKRVVNERVQELIGQAACERLSLKDDAWDAVGIGLYLKGVFK